VGCRIWTWFRDYHVVGSIHVQEASAFRAGVALEASAEGVGADGTATTDASETKSLIGRGVVGIRIYFFHLVKTKNNPTIRMKQHFPVRESHDKKLQYLFGSMATKIRRKIIDSKPPISRALVMAESYESSGDFQQDIATLEELADEEADAFQRRDEPMAVEYIASLRIVGETNADGKLSSGSWEGKFARSNNALYWSSLEDLKRIYKAIKDHGTVSIKGKVADTIKPVIQGQILDSLPIMYKEDLSGTCPRGGVPSWVLRADQDGNLLTLWGVSGLDLNSGIVSAYDQNQWHVRESIEYVKKEDKKLIEDLKLEGFFQLHPDEVDPEEVDPLQVKNGSVVMMGRHFLGLKRFDAPDEA